MAVSSILRIVPVLMIAFSASSAIANNQASNRMALGIKLEPRPGGQAAIIYSWEASAKYAVDLRTNAFIRVNGSVRTVQPSGTTNPTIGCPGPIKIADNCCTQVCCVAPYTCNAQCSCRETVTPPLITTPLSHGDVVSILLVPQSGSEPEANTSDDVMTMRYSTAAVPGSSTPILIISAILIVVIGSLAARPRRASDHLGVG